VVSVRVLRPYAMRVQIDVRFTEPVAGAASRPGGRNKYYQFTAIDDCTGCGSCGSTRC
jgi:hypothetical protein